MFLVAGYVLLWHDTRREQGVQVCMLLTFCFLTHACFLVMKKTS